MGQNMHSLALLNDGTVKAFGDNTSGQLGLGNTTTPITTPTLIPGLSNVKQIACGNGHSLVLLNDGTVKAFGYNTSGQLGLGNTTPYTSPIVIPSLTNVKQISCGSNHSLVLLNDGTVYGFGNNIGQLGLGNTTDQHSPTLISSLSNVNQIACGSSHSLVLLNDGTVKAFGYNNNGQLGLGNTTSPYTTPTLIPSLTNVTQISGGQNYSLVLLNGGTVKAFGYNGYGQLGLGNTTTSITTPTLIPSLTNVKQISCGNIRSLVLLNGGTVKAFGYNGDGRLGLGNTTTPITTPTLIPSLTNVKQISDGYSHSLVLLNDGTVKGFGINDNGQLGLGDVTTRTTPTLIPNLSNVTLLWDSNILLVILIKRFVMFKTVTKSTYGKI